MQSQKVVKLSDMLDIGLLEVSET